MAVALARDFYIGNMHVQIYDDYCVKTKEEVDAILRSVGEIWYNAELAKLEAERAVKGS